MRTYSLAGQDLIKVELLQTAITNQLDSCFFLSVQKSSSFLLAALEMVPQGINTVNL